MSFFSYQLKKWLFLDDQEKSNFQKFFYQILNIIRRHQKLPKYKFLWKKLKNWIFPGQKTEHQKLTFSSLSLKKSLFLDGQEKSNFLNFSTKFCRSLEDVLNYLNINFYEYISKIGFFLAKKRRANSHFRHCNTGSNLVIYEFGMVDTALVLDVKWRRYAVMDASVV